MGNAKRDENYVPTLLAVSNADGVTPVVLYADPTTHRLLVSAVAGALDDLSDVVITSGAQGDILYNNGTNWVNLAAGTSGKFLKTQGAGANPLWDTPTAGAAGTDTQVQFNDGGSSLGGDAGFVYNKTTNVATLGGLNVTGLTASELIATDASKNLVSLAVATYPSLTELTYLKGVTSAIQTQLNAKGDAVTSGTLGQFAATTSAQLAGVISDETGSGSLVFATSPTLVTPVLGVATATSINKVTITAPATGSTLTIPDGVTFTGPSASGTAMTLGNAETVSGVKTFNDGTVKMNGATSGAITLKAPAIASTYVLTLPAVTGTVGALELAQTWTAAQTYGDALLIATSPKIVTGIKDTNGNSIIAFSATASAVNQLTVVNAATGNAVDLQATGSDTNIDLKLTAKGTGKIAPQKSVNFGAFTAYFTETDNGNSSTADTIDWTLSNKQKSTLTGNCTFTFTAPPGPCSLILKLVQDATGSRTVTWPATVHWSGGTAPTLTTTVNKVDIISFYYDGTTYFGNSTLNFTA